MVDRFVGITVMPEYVQCEGIDEVLDNLVERANATAVTTSPYVMAATSEGRGQREPPIDAGAGNVRLLDRPLWGQRELFVETAPSFIPQTELYRGVGYEPAMPGSLTYEHGHVVGDFLKAARERGLNTYLQIQAAIPPGYRVQFGGPSAEDMPCMPDGTCPAERVASNASLAAPSIVAYQAALIQDLLSVYPDIDGIRFDWPEYPPYELDSIFMDFSPHVEAYAAKSGIDFREVREQVSRLYQYLHGSLTTQDLERVDDACKLIATRTTRPSADEPADSVMQWLQLKRELSNNLLSSFRTVMDDCGAKHVALVAHAFPPPWSDLSGIDFAAGSGVVDHYCVKLYGMHWLMMIRFYADQLLNANPDELDETALIRSLFDAFDVDNESGAKLASDVRYPAPEEPHPGTDATRARKVSQAQTRAGKVPVHALEHGYGPTDDFARRIRIALDASNHRIWVNRYGYLSDAKLDIIGQLGSF